MDVLIVGAGPVGLTLANELARFGIHFRIIDKLPQPVILSKALAVQARTLELLERFPGVAEKFVNDGLELTHGKIHLQKNSLAQIDLSKIPSRYPFVLSLPQSQTETILRDHLQTQAHTVEMGVELLSFETNSSGVTAKLQHADGTSETVNTKWLIACDGARSTIRQQLNLPFEGSTFNDERFMLADIRLSRPLQTDEINIFLQSGNILACFPLPGQHYRIIAEQPKTAVTGAFDVNHLQDLIHQIMGLDFNIEEVFWFSEFKINQRKIPHYQVGKVFLLGDAAHIHSPVGGQGMNTGIQDAINLAWKLAFYLQGNATELLLNTFDQEREAVAEQLLRDTDRATKMVMLTSPIKIKIRNFILQKILQFSWVQKKILLGLSELAINYQSSILSHRAGDPWPDADITYQGHQTRWYKILSWVKWNLVIVGASEEKLNVLRQALLPYQSTINYIVMTKEDCTLPAGNLYLIRPDAYLGFGGELKNTSELLNYCQQFISAKNL